jgi:hypothetical protein
VSELFSQVSDRGLTLGLWTRRLFVTLFALIALLALLNTFGQRPSSSQASAPAARMTVQAPERVRGGLLFQSRIDIRALQPIEHPRLVFDDGWLEGMQVNSIEPAADTESSRNGRLVLSYGSLESGDVLRVWVQFQADPTNPGSRPYGVELDDAEQRVARIDRTITVLP